MSFGERVRTARKRLGMSQERFAEQLGVTRGAVGNWEKDANPNLPETDRLPEIARVLQVTVDYLMERSDTFDSPEPSNVRMGTPISLAKATMQWPTMPVLGTAQAGPNGAFEMNRGEPIDHVRRPRGLEGVKECYSIYVEGDSMWPKFEPGQQIYVHAKRPPAINRDVVIQLKPGREGDTPIAYLKRLVRRNSEEIEVLQFNPMQKRVFKMNEVLSIHLVLREDELI